MSGFTHLNVASSFSGHYGVTHPALLAEAAAASGASALAITDRNGLYGAVKHIGACLKLGIDPIVGVNLEVAELGRVTVLARGSDGGIGWAALCRTVSAAAKGKPIRISREELEIGRAHV